MDPEDFKSTIGGKVVSRREGYFAFIPAPLPPEVAFDQDLVLQLSRADVALSELSGIGGNLPDPHILIGPLLRREAVLSSKIEGTQSSLSDLLMEDALPASASKKGDTSDLKEVQNYVSSLEYGLKRLAELPLSLRLVREIHEKLMTGVRGERATPGEFRRSQNWIGPAGTTPANAPYVPPPLEEMGELLSNWEKYLHLRDSMPDLIQCAILHEQFEAIHPFLDGNGRVGRLLITLFLVERGRLSQPLLYLSDYIERHRSDYYELLQRVRTHGEWLPWIRFFLAGIDHTARDASNRARRLIALRESMIRETDGALALADRLLTNPYLTISGAAKALEVTVPTATKIIKMMEDKGLLRETTGKSWGKMYVAQAILTIVEAPTPS